MEMAAKSSRRGTFRPTQIFIINACSSPEKIHSSQTNAFQLNLRPHFVTIPDFLNPSDNCLTSYASLKDAVEKHITTTIKPINSENSMFLLPKTWFNAINGDLMSDLTKHRVCSIGMKCFTEMAASSFDPIGDLYQISRNLHPRYCMVLKSYSFIINPDSFIINPDTITSYKRLVSLIRYMGGLIRAEAQPGRQNQVLITDDPKNKNGILSDMRMPIITLESITKLWEAVDDEKFSANRFSTNKV